MAAQQPFTWAFGGQKITTPEQAERQRKIAAALIDRAPSQNWAQGLGSITAALASNAIGERVGQAETEGRGRAGALFSDLALNADPNSIIAALTSEDAAWASPSQTSIASALLNTGLERSDPAYQLDMQYKQAQLDALQNPQPENPYLNVGGGSIFDTQSGQFITAPNTAQTDLPADVQEYQWYVEGEKAAGREPLDYVGFTQALKGNGLSVQTNADGTTTITQGGPTKLTETQGKDVGFYTRGLDANTALDSLEGELTDWSQQNAGKIPLGLGNYLREPQFRQAKVAADSFLTAILRKDTGAGVTDTEFELYGPMFLPVPGDDPGTIQTKKRMRDVALLGIRSGLGTADAIAQANATILGGDTSITPRDAAPVPPGASAAPGGVIDWTDL